MLNLVKKIVATATVLTCSVMMVAPAGAGAMTAAELEAQINALMAQLAALQGQLGELEGTGGTGGVAIEGIPAGFTFDTNLKLGMSNDDVKYMQIVLNSDTDTKLADSGVGSAGNETFYFGPLTKSGVVKFQEKYASDVLAVYGLTSGTGFVGSTTRAKLDSLLTSVPPTEECTVDTDCSLGYKCELDTCVVKSTTEITTSDECSAAGYFWYDATCNATAEVLATDITIGLASDTSVASHVAKGAQGVIFTIVKLTGGSTGTTITKVIVARGGVSADADISAIQLYDGVTQVGSTQALNTLTHKATFSSLSYEVPAGETKYLTLKGDIATGPTVGDTVKLGIVSASDISSTETLEGSFPIWGNAKTIAGISVGVLDVTKQSAPALATILSGSTEQDISAFKFAADLTEGFAVHKIVVTHVGSATANDIKNIKLKVSGVQLGETVVSLDAQNRAVFDLSSAPLSINSSSNKTVHAYCDVAEGVWTERTIIFEITQYTDVTAYGANSGGATTITWDDSGTSTAFAKQTGQTMTIGQGSLTVALDASLNPASQNYVKGISGKDFVAYRFSAGSTEGVRVAKLKFKLATGVNTDISNITLWDGTTQIAGPASIVGSYATFGSNTIGWDTTGLFDVEKSTNKTIVVKADIPSGATASNSLSLDLDAVTDIWIDGLSSKYDITQNTTNIILTGNGNTHTVSAYGTLTVSKSSNTPPAQTYVIGATEKEFTRIDLSAGSGEDIVVTAITLDLLANGVIVTSTNHHLVNVKLVNADTGVQYGSTVANPTATADFSGTLIVPASGIVTLKAIADVPTSGYPIPNTSIEIATASIGTAIATAIESTGVFSSADITETGSADGSTMTISTGSLTVSDASTPGDQSLIIGASEVSFVGLVMEAGTAEDVRVTFVRLTTSGSSWCSTTDVSNIALYDGDTRLTTKKNLTVASAATSRHHTVTYSASDFLNSQGINITKGAQKVITVKADLPSTGTATHKVAFGVSTTDDIVVSGLSSNTEISETLTGDTTLIGPNYDVNNGAGNLSEVTITAKGTFAAANNSGKPVVAINAVGKIADGLSDVTFHKVDFTASLEDIYVKTISVERAGGSDDDFGQISVWDGTTQLGVDQVLVGATTTFSFPEGSYWLLSKGVKKTLTIKADLNGVKTEGEYGASTGDAPYMRLDSITVQGKSSGSTSIVVTSAIDLAGNIQYIRQSKPTIAAASLPTTVLTTGEKTLYRWTVTADSKGDIGWRKAAFNVTGAFTINSASRAVNATSSTHHDGLYAGYTKIVNGFKVWNVTDNVQVTATTSAYDGTDLTTAVGAFVRCDADANAGEYVLFVAGEEQEIAAGTTKTYELRGTVLVAPTTGDNLLVKMSDLSTAVATDGYLAVSGTEDKAFVDNYATTSISFIWTDRSGATGTHGLESADWTNDYKVEGIPSSTLSLTK